MPRRLRLAVAPLVLLIATLTACAEPTRLPPPEEPAARAPLFASDEEALAAATEAYEEYLAVSNAITSNPDAPLAPLQEKTSSAHFENLEASITQLRAQGLRSEGSSALASVELQQHSQIGDEILIVVYVCLDVSSTRLLDQNGNDVTPRDRADRVALEVALINESGALRDLIVDGSETWTGGLNCS